MTFGGQNRIEELLGRIELFSGLEPAVLSKLAAHGEVVHVPGGEILMREGDASDALFVVASGRLQAFVDGGGGETLVGEIGRGEVIGEMGILAGEPRSATVRTLRDSILVRIPSDAFLRFLREEPNELLEITQLLIKRLRRSIRSDAAAAPVRTITVLPVGEEPEAETFARFLTSVLAERRNTRLVRGEDLEDAADDDELTRRLHDLETAHDLLIYLADRQPSAWTDRCLRQADRVVLLGDANSEVGLTEVEKRLLGGGASMVRARLDLVLVQPAAASMPRHGARWLAQRPVHRIHHVRLHSRDDMQRVARALTGQEVALVLSGGGARGIAHFGLFRALTELGIPVDVVGGSSFGSIAAAALAMGWTWEEQRQVFYESFVSRGSPIDFTAPAVALAKGEKVTAGIRRAFGDILIENLWLRYFCVSSNLSAGDVAVHTRGPLWRSLRASVAIPGLWPPVASEEGDILVDGGVMNNLPVDVMETYADAGVLIAVNLKGSADLPSHGLSGTGVLSGWGPLARRLSPAGSGPGLPGIVELLLRATETGNVLSAKRLEQQADIVLHPDVAEFGLLAWERLDEIIEAGYRYAMKELPAHEDKLKSVL